MHKICINYASWNSSGPLGGAAAGFYESDLHVLSLSDQLSKLKYGVFEIIIDHVI